MSLNYPWCLRIGLELGLARLLAEIASNAPDSMSVSVSLSVIVIVSVSECVCVCAFVYVYVYIIRIGCLRNGVLLQSHLHMTRHHPTHTMAFTSISLA